MSSDLTEEERKYVKQQIKKDLDAMLKANNLIGGNVKSKTLAKEGKRKPSNSRSNKPGLIPIWGKRTSSHSWAVEPDTAEGNQKQDRRNSVHRSRSDISVGMNNFNGKGRYFDQSPNEFQLKHQLILSSPIDTLRSEQSSDIPIEYKASYQNRYHSTDASDARNPQKNKVTVYERLPENSVWSNSASQSTSYQPTNHLRTDTVKQYDRPVSTTLQRNPNESSTSQFRDIQPSQETTRLQGNRGSQILGVQNQQNYEHVKLPLVETRPTRIAGSSVQGAGERLRLLVRNILGRKQEITSPISREFLHPPPPQRALAMSNFLRERPQYIVERLSRSPTNTQNVIPRKASRGHREIVRRAPSHSLYLKRREPQHTHQKQEYGRGLPNLDSTSVPTSGVHQQIKTHQHNIPGVQYLSKAQPNVQENSQNTIYSSPQIIQYGTNIGSTRDKHANNQQYDMLPTSYSASLGQEISPIYSNNPASNSLLIPSVQQNSPGNSIRYTHPSNTISQQVASVGVKFPEPQSSQNLLISGVAENSLHFEHTKGSQQQLQTSNNNRQQTHQQSGQQRLQHISEQHQSQPEKTIHQTQTQSSPIRRQQPSQVQQLQMTPLIDNQQTIHKPQTVQQQHTPQFITNQPRASSQQIIYLPTEQQTPSSQTNQRLWIHHSQIGRQNPSQKAQQQQNSPSTVHQQKQNSPTIINQHQLQNGHPQTQASQKVKQTGQALTQPPQQVQYTQNGNQQLLPQHTAQQKQQSVHHKMEPSRTNYQYPLQPPQTMHQEHQLPSQIDRQQSSQTVQKQQMSHSITNLQIPSSIQTQQMSPSQLTGQQMRPPSTSQQYQLTHQQTIKQKLTQPLPRGHQQPPPYYQYIMQPTQTGLQQIPSTETGYQHILPEHTGQHIQTPSTGQQYILPLPQTMQHQQTKLSPTVQYQQMHPPHTGLQQMSSTQNGYQQTGEHVQHPSIGQQYQSQPPQTGRRQTQPSRTVQQTSQTLIQTSQTTGLQQMASTKTGNQQMPPNQSGQHIQTQSTGQQYRLPLQQTIQHQQTQHLQKGHQQSSPTIQHQQMQPRQTGIQQMSSTQASYQQTGQQVQLPSKQYQSQLKQTIPQQQAPTKKHSPNTGKQYQSLPLETIQQQQTKPSHLSRQQPPQSVQHQQMHPPQKGLQQMSSAQTVYQQTEQKVQSPGKGQQYQSQHPQSGHQHPSPTVQHQRMPSTQAINQQKGQQVQPPNTSQQYRSPPIQTIQQQQTQPSQTIRQQPFTDRSVSTDATFANRSATNVVYSNW
ncbi:chromatin modification-related protein eaf-1-like [Pecten maximus]|uniref:chromatin modification-related protein eaf-1-like n=1 Tax=Pecten maximus TaxID=6579 RepID=UPI00145874BE|nr:chromatin modification-related protein eaf-1-like [Pecten maximus]